MNYMPEKKLQIAQILAILIVPFVFYYNLIDNFFVWDDYFWLYRAMTLQGNPTQIFDSEGTYFRPMIYIFFWINYNLFGLAHTYYNIIDIAIHAVNAVLVFLIAFKITENRLTSFLSALLFATTFSAANAIMWMSARTDLLCMFFSLLSVFLYIGYLEKKTNLFYIGSLAVFILGLLSKGTIVILPLIIILVSRRFKKTESGFLQFLPFIALSIVYFALLTLDSSSVPSQTENVFTFKWRFYNFFLGMATFFFTYQTLISHQILIYITPFMLVGMAFVSRSSHSQFGLLFMLISLLPLLNIADPYVLSNWGKQSITLIGSPSNRVYLASAGAAMFASSFMVWLYGKIPLKRLSGFLLCTVLAVILYRNYENLQMIEWMWSMESSRQEKLIKGMKARVPSVEKGSTIVLLTSPPISPAFAHPMLKVFYDDEDLVYFPLPSMPAYLPDDPRLINTAIPMKVHAFATSGNYDHVYDVTEIYKKALEVAFMYKLSDDEVKSSEYKENYSRLAGYLNKLCGSQL